MTLKGSNFYSGCTVRWKGSERPATYVNSTTLKYLVTTADIYSSGTVTVSVSCGGKLSESISFPVNNPLPALSYLSPDSATAGGKAFLLTIVGSGFVPASSVQWNGVGRTAMFHNQARLTLVLDPADISIPGTVTVAVSNSAPGGGISNILSFEIKASDLLITTTRLPDAVHDKNYAYDLQAGGGIPPYSWSIVSGILPDGLKLVSGKILGTPPAVASDTTVRFGARVTDSALNPSSTTRELSIRVRSGSLGRNETCTTATPISSGIIRASVSPFGDVDVYFFYGTKNTNVTIETVAQRLADIGSNSPDIYLDSFLELLDLGCNRLLYNDDMDISTLDSGILNYRLPYTGIYYIRISDLRGDGRPDFIYEIRLSGVD